MRRGYDQRSIFISAIFAPPREIAVYVASSTTAEPDEGSNENEKRGSFGFNECPEITRPSHFRLTLSRYAYGSSKAVLAGDAEGRGVFAANNQSLQASPSPEKRSLFVG